MYDLSPENAELLRKLLSSPNRRIPYRSDPDFRQRVRQLRDLGYVRTAFSSGPEYVILVSSGIDALRAYDDSVKHRAQQEADQRSRHQLEDERHRASVRRSWVQWSLGLLINIFTALLGAFSEMRTGWFSAFWDFITHPFH